MFLPHTQKVTGSDECVNLLDCGNHFVIYICLPKHHVLHPKLQRKKGGGKKGREEERESS